MTEVEMKAHVVPEKRERLETELENRYGKPVAVSKSDIYYKGKDGQLFRMRECNGKFFYNKKVHHMDGNCEKNDETEYEVDVKKAAELTAGCGVYFKKAKKGFSWKASLNTHGMTFDMNIELLEVSSLGVFLETEILIPDNSPENASEEAEEFLAAFFADCGLSDCIEKRKYMELAGVGLC